MPSVFLDSNVLLYAVTINPTEAGKRRAAVELIESLTFGVSSQVLAEFYTVATRTGAPRMTPDEATSYIARLSHLPIVPVDQPLVMAGIAHSRRYAISYWDGAIIAAAERLGAGILYTEDLNHGQSYGSVRVMNPFLEG